ncbi:MAG: ribosomal L7Ae/L30e/S12e/Gadd45 family protein [Eubacterium sp.]|nr:ribosomal L7Ae/L30e/S12e/Gadd45 family protein [Eubacterium sp.]
MHKALSMLGIAAKAGKAASGETAVEQAVRKGKAALVIISEDASENTGKKFRNLCIRHEVPLLVFETKETLGRAIGKGERSSVAVLDTALAEAVRKQI